MESEKVIEVATLGRPFRLGMLYDCRQDAIIPGLTLWDSDDLEKDKSETPQPNSNFEIVASESIQDKSSALDVKASLKASFLGGLVTVEGSAEYLNDQMTSKNQARVTLQYKATTKFQELSMNHLGRGNMKHPDVFENKIATHVVTGILYGAQAFFVFDQEKSETENRQDIQGNLKVLIEKIPTFSIDGKGSLHLEDKDKEKIQKFSCKFHGDFLLEKTPTTFQDAVAVYQSLPKLLGASGENAVPIKVWMLPLTNLDSSAAKLVREISVRLVQEVQSVLEELSDLEIRSNDAMKNITTQQFPQINKKLKSFKSLCSEFRLGFQQTLSKKLPSIRGGGEEESELADVLKKIHSSPFNSKNLNDWIDCKEREIYALKSYTRMMKNTKIKTSLTILDEELLNAEHAVCFVFSSLERDEPYLSALLNYLEDKTKSDDSHSYDIEKEQWYLSNNLKDEMRTKVKLFSDFAEANTETKNTTFLAVGLTDEKHEGSTIYLYKDGFPISKNFEPPSKPETVTAADINHSSVTLKVSPPRFGAESVTSYSVEFCVRGQDEWKQQNEPKSSEITVTQLQPNTEYVFRCRAVTSAGIGPANVINDPIKTLPCSPAGEPQCEPNSSEISVSWEKPAELGPDVQILSYIVECAKVEDLSWNQTRSKGEKAIISGLQSETQYSVRITCDCGGAGRSKESKIARPERSSLRAREGNK
ncbi:neoverrucotoxin subunit alpha-like isoform X2 [Xiphophorus hellerii]|uniref:neoverrucotoxin subunit alpha-like isoform X2 n=1 Tax=Xiphophorus hellerii TaxID=8084 RepID=UPI0013B47137|nr:neoverrucotoxin subunit alpha-like isoform X2 [Xiphophorus hellerii]